MIADAPSIFTMVIIGPRCGLQRAACGVEPFVYHRPDRSATGFRQVPPPDRTPYAPIAKG